MRTWTVSTSLETLHLMSAAQLNILNGNNRPIFAPKHIFSCWRKAVEKSAGCSQSAQRTPGRPAALAERSAEVVSPLPHQLLSHSPLVSRVNPRKGFLKETKALDAQLLLLLRRVRSGSGGGDECLRPAHPPHTHTPPPPPTPPERWNISNLWGFCQTR